MSSDQKNAVLSTLSSDEAVRNLYTVRDFVEYGVSLFGESGLFFGHGTDNESDEAIFMVLEGLHLPIYEIEPYWDKHLTDEERLHIASLLRRRAETRLPAPYILNKAYIQGFPFYVDERVLVPRSFIAEILCREDGFSGIRDYEAVGSVLDLCTGSGCLGIVAAEIFPNARIDIADLSADALEVARRNVRDYALEDRVTIYQGDLFEPLRGKAYDLIITNPPYVDKTGMDTLPEEFRHEPAMALGAGEDGMDIVHRIMKEAKFHLNDGGGLLCEVGRCGPDLEKAYPRTPFRWIATENSSDEVFWLKKKDL
jgi:ribosomal protein L3 glutamine methyltransferase